MPRGSVTFGKSWDFAPRPAILAPMETRPAAVPSNDLNYVAMVCALLAGLCLGGVAGPLDAPVACFALGTAFLATCLGLRASRIWARPLGVTTLIVLSALASRWWLRDGATPAIVFLALGPIFWASTLSFPIAGRAVAAGAGRLHRPLCASALARALPVFTLVACFHALAWPAWLALSAAALWVVLFDFVLLERLVRRLDFLLAVRPEDLEPAAWVAFRRAWRARLRGCPEESRTLLAGLPAHPAVSTLRGLAESDASIRTGGLDRIVFDADWTPPESRRATIRDACGQDDLLDLVERRACLVDDLLQDAAGPCALFAAELGPALERLSARIFAMQAELQSEEWWRSARPWCTGVEARSWLVVRLLAAECPEAAELVARRVGDPLLEQLTGLACAIQNATTRPPALARLHSRRRSVFLLAEIADRAGVLFLDGPMAQAEGLISFARALERRCDLVLHVLELWDRYDEELALEATFWLHYLVGAPAWFLHARRRFERWWNRRSSVELLWDRAFGRGLRAAAQEDWRAAADAFREADRAVPTRASAAYNRAMCLLRAESPDEAARTLESLAERRPKEATILLRLGDCRRLQERTREALECYRRAVDLGDPNEESLARLGAILADEEGEEAAAAAIDRAIGLRKDPDFLEELASQLEAEGAYGLARRYRDAALHRDLDPPPGDDDDDDGGVGAR